jgi:uncharacterized protein RhaS with RHS repeats
MDYNDIHNITRKNQRHWIIQNNGTEKVQTGTTYDWTYAYASPKPHAPTTVGNVAYTYDLNGNQTGFVASNVTRIIAWDEENRVKNIADGGSTTSFTYDYNNQRVIKTGSQGETAYINQFYTVRNGTEITKHYIAGNDRIASRVKTSKTNFLYYYMPDHLGSTNYTADANGAIYEHMEYFPFGEMWVGERASSNRTPFLFTSKELDGETGLYYFGARYYDARQRVAECGWGF